MINMEEEQQRPQEKIKEVHHYHHEKGRRARLGPGRIFVGILVVLIGLFLLGSKIGLVQLNMQLDILDIWPVLVIFIGLTMISFRGFLGILIGITMAMVAAIVVFLMLFGHLNVNGTNWDDWDFKFEISSNEVFQNNN